MPIIKIKEDAILLSDVQKCTAVLADIVSGKEADKKLSIVAEQAIKKFDPILIAYLLIYKVMSPEIFIELVLPMNSVSSSDSEVKSVAYQLYQYRTSGFLSTKKVLFKLQLGTDRSDYEGWENWTSFNENLFVFSSKFFPVLLITDEQEQFDLLFEKSLESLCSGSLDKLPTGVRWKADHGELKTALHAAIKLKVSPMDPTEAMVGLAQMYFYHALDQAKVTSIYFEDEYDSEAFSGDVIKASFISNRTLLDYYRSVKPVFDDLKNSSLFHQFLFATLLSDEELKAGLDSRLELRSTNADKWRKRIFKVWRFTNDLIVGIKELAKNVREHSKPGIGAIAVRVFTTQELIEIKETSGNAQEENIYRKELSDISRYPAGSMVLEVNVLDVGKKGVIETLVESTERIYNNFKGNNKDMAELIEEDLSRLSAKNGISFIDLFDDSKNQLNQQSKRSIAHFGLLTLSRLIKARNGFLIASTQTSDDIKKRESACVSKESYPCKVPFEIGTNYSLIIPIMSSDSYSSFLPQPISLPTETTEKDIAGLERLFDYDLVDAVNVQNSSNKDGNGVIDPNYKFLIRFSFQEQKILNRLDEHVLWVSLVDQAKFIDGLRKRDVVVCLDLSNVSINESQLFRLLGKFELEYPRYPLILFNLENQAYQKLVALNTGFNEANPKLDYWNGKIATLVYSYVTLEDKRFHLCDILFGTVKSDFLQINLLAGFSAFNSTSMEFSVEQVAEIKSVEEIADPGTRNLFYNTNQPLPFELLLPGKIGTLFEENAIVLLSNELRPR